MKGTICVIEDNDIDQLIVHKMLESCLPGISIRSFSSAQHALGEVADDRLKANIILLNLNMPLMNGWDFLEAFTQLKSPIPIYILTSSDSYKDRDRAKNYSPVKAYFLKPLSRKDILKIADEINVTQA